MLLLPAACDPKTFSLYLIHIGRFSRYTCCEELSSTSNSKFFNIPLPIEEGVYCGFVSRTLIVTAAVLSFGFWLFFYVGAPFAN
jgi:hypothetical protein